MDIKAKALLFATKAHKAIEHKRKYTNEDYIVHPVEVADTVATVGGSDDMIAAAYLHDDVEDTGISLETIRQEFGINIMNLVSDLTDVGQLSDGPRAVRKALDLKHSALASPEAKTIKLADLIANTKSIVKHDPKFAKIYLAEKEALLKVLVDGNKTLHQQASKLLQESLNIIYSQNKPLSE